MLNHARPQRFMASGSQCTMHKQLAVLNPTSVTSMAIQIRMKKSDPLYGGLGPVLRLIRTLQLHTVTLSFSLVRSRVRISLPPSTPPFLPLSSSRLFYIPCLFPLSLLPSLCFSPFVHSSRSSGWSTIQQEKLEAPSTTTAAASSKRRALCRAWARSRGAALFWCAIIGHVQEGRYS